MIMIQLKTEAYLRVTAIISCFVDNTIPFKPLILIRQNPFYYHCNTFFYYFNNRITLTDVPNTVKSHLNITYIQSGTDTPEH